MSRLARLIAAAGLVAAPVIAWTAAGPAGAQTIAGYNAGALAIGAQFGFNVPNVVPLPNENLIEEDVPFARTNVGGGPVVDALAAPYYPGDLAADLGSLLQEFGAPALPINDPLLAESKFPVSPGYPAHKTFGVQPSAATPLVPSIFSSTADSSANGGDATGTLSGLSLDNLAATPNAGSGLTKSVTKTLQNVLNSTAASLVDVGNVSATNNVALTSGAITSTATTDVKAIDIAGLIDIDGLTSTATATSDGTTGTPTASLHLGQVTVDGQSAYIDDKGVHIPTTNPIANSITPAQLQQTVNGTLAQDGISIRVLDPQLTTNAAAATSNAGGLVITISHQFDIPFIPGEPTLPALPELGAIGLPAGLYTATTTLTFGLAQANVAASNIGSSDTTPPSVTTPTLGTSSLGSGFDSGSTFPSTFGGSTGVVQSVAPSGPGSAAGNGNRTFSIKPSTATAFPIKGVPPPLGWTIAGLLACILAAYPLLLLARWQFLGRRA
jgi:hypothetical protein